MFNAFYQQQTWSVFSSGQIQRNSVVFKASCQLRDLTTVKVTLVDSFGLIWLLLGNISGHYKLCMSGYLCLSIWAPGGRSQSQQQKSSLQATCLHSWQSSWGTYLPFSDSFHLSVLKPSLYFSFHLWTSFSCFSAWWSLRCALCRGAALQSTHHQSLERKERWRKRSREDESGAKGTGQCVSATHIHSFYFVFLKLILLPYQQRNTAYKNTSSTEGK